MVQQPQPDALRRVHCFMFTQSVQFGHAQQFAAGNFVGSGVAMCCVKRGLFHPGELVDDVGSQVSLAPAGAIEAEADNSRRGAAKK